MRICARDQIAGRVTEVRRGTTARVRIEVAPGVAVTAPITNEACDDLALAPSDKVTATIKASDVMVGK